VFSLVRDLRVLLLHVAVAKVPIAVLADNGKALQLVLGLFVLSCAYRIAWCLIMCGDPPQLTITHLVVNADSFSTGPRSTCGDSVSAPAFSDEAA
jgi:hypothetical protein